MTKVVSQRAAVYSATTSVFADKGIKFEDGMSAKALMTDELSELISMIVCEGFKSGAIELKQTPSNAAKLADDKVLKKYVSGLISNWYLKDTRLNGNTKHEIKNPGSRSFNDDDQVVALRNLIKAKPADAAELKVYLDNRIATLKAQHAPAQEIEVNYDALPESIRAKYSK